MPDLPPVSLTPYQKAVVQAYGEALADAARAIARMEPTWARVAADMRAAMAAMGYVQQPDHAHRLHVAYDRRRRARRRRRNH